ncbi:MAG: hypothetical protein P0121_05095 [Nitrospira sp.]|nr:hypothetical protein [Nitrospira sp.]
MFVVTGMACSTGPPRELIERNDHSGLATWYEQEALRLRSKAEEMHQMAELYATPSYRPAPRESKSELIFHCRPFMDYYTKASDEAEALAKLHREQEPSIP